MNGIIPKVSIGMPVFNGERYLPQALESLVGQTWTGKSFAGMEIIISDNCSSDSTENICRHFASTDPRIRYFRQTSNIGAGPNYNFVFHKSRGSYFKWAAHDDFMDLTAIEECARALDEDPGTVLCHPLIVDVDLEGEVIAEFDRGKSELLSAPEHFFRIIQAGHNCAEVFGLIRKESLARTKLIRNYTDSDRTLLGELSLMGRFRQVAGVRFYRRVHLEKSDRVFPSFHERAEWFLPSNRNKVVFSALNQLRDLTGAVLLCNLPMNDKARCAIRLAKVAKWKAPLFRKEIAWAWQRRMGRT